MSKAIVIQTGPAQSDTQIELSEGKRQQFYRESLNIFSQGVAFGWKADFYKAISLFNIKNNRLHEIDGKDWNGFVGSLEISQRSIERYLRIAQRIREMMKAAGVTPLLATYITQKDFNTTFEPFFANGKQANLRGLIAASKNLESFQGYLSGKDVEDKQVFRLLAKNNQKSPEQKEREEREAKINAEMEAESQSFYRTEAAARGYEWDDDSGAYRNPDGTPLSDKQQTEFITAVDALRVWSRSEQVLASAKSEIEHAVKAYGGTFKSYRKHATDNAFHAKAQEKFTSALKMLEWIDDNLRAVHADE